MQYTLPQMASMLKRVGDVIPFGKRLLYPNPMSEGGKPYQGSGDFVLPQRPGESRYDAAVRYQQEYAALKKAGMPDEMIRNFLINRDEMKF